jgi:hypothetical protein
MELKGWLAERGFGDVRPRRLGEAGNVLVLLDPLPVVARISVLEPGDDPAKEAAVATRELAVARYLADRGCPVAAPADQMAAGPHCLRGAVMTLWTYIRELPGPSSAPGLGSPGSGTGSSAGGFSRAAD